MFVQNFNKLLFRPVYFPSNFISFFLNIEFIIISFVKNSKSETMKKTIIQLSLLISASYCQSQIVTSSATEDYNNVNATLTDGGVYFNDLSNTIAGYEVPKGSGISSIFLSSFWYGGTDSNNQIHLSGQTYTANSDIFTGPFSSNNSYLDPLYISKYSPSIWKVKKYDITQHILNFASAGYVTPNSILNWPGNGDPTLGVSLQLAPFIDLDNDGIYEPTQGDYPDIKGCEASFIILNDDAQIHSSSGGAKIEMEVHVMVYQYATADYLDNTTFISKKIINKGSQTLNNFRTSFFMDGDLGNAGDDFVGCDSVRKLMYTYNGDSNDEANGGLSGYGHTPPSISAISLNNELANSGHFINGAAIGMGDPSSAVEYFNYMNGKWSNGIPMTFGGIGYGGTTPCNFNYPTNPNSINDPMPWSEVSEQNPPGDRRQYMTVNSGVFAPGDTLDLDFAILFGQNTDTSNYLSCINNLMDIADSVQAFYNSNIDICTDPSAGLNEKNSMDFKIYPNPTNGSFVIELQKPMEEIILEITDMSGRVVLSKTYKNQFEINIDLKEQAGMYIVKMKNNTEVTLYKLMVE